MVQHNSCLLDDCQNTVQGLPMRTFLSTWEKTPRKQESCDASFFRTQACLGVCSRAPPGYSRQEEDPFSCCYLCLCFCHVWLVIVITCVILNPQRINCPMLKDGFGMRLKPPHFSALFSQVPAPLEWRTDHKRSFQNIASRHTPGYAGLWINFENP